MAEICCDVMASKRSRTATACNVSSRAARRRRMELRRFKFVAAKRQRCSEGDVVVVAGNSGVAQVKIGSEELVDVRPRFGVSSVCGRRRDMEDATTAELEFVKSDGNLGVKHHFFGVYDGHGCSHVATSCKERMHEVVAYEMESLRVGARTQPWWRFVMERSFARMDDEVTTDSLNGRESAGDCKCEMRTPRCDHVGSTAVVAVVNPTSIVVANCGDSRAILGRAGAAIPLSIDHKPDRPDELQRIEAAGGRVIDWDGPRVLGVLAMSRAIGDAYLKPYVISEPEITVTERTPEDEFLILASDGLWDVVSNEMACGIVRMCLRTHQSVDGDGEENKACSDAATLLTRVAMARRSADNISVVVVDLRRPSD